MKKITLLCLAGRKEEALEALRDLGVLHVVSVKAPEGGNLERARERLARAERAVRALPSGPETLAEPDEKAPEGRKLVERVLALKDRRDRATDLLRELHLEHERIAPLGDFDPRRLGELEAHGVVVRLYQAPAKAPIAAPEGTVLTELARDPNVVVFALSGEADAFPDEPPYAPFRLPEHSLSWIDERMERQRREIAELDGELATCARWRDEVEAELAAAREAADFVAVRDGMGEAVADRVAYLRGWCPADRVGRLKQAAAERGWAVVADDPAPDDEPPTLVKYPGWVKPIKPVFDMLEILPGYREADISIAFLIFFSLFFGILIGDAGYGLLFLGATIGARLAFSKAPREPFILFGILSCATIVWGALTGNYFGITDLPGPLAGLKVAWLDSHEHIMRLCFFIGAVHLSIAHVWNAVLLYPDRRFLAQIGWACLVWTMFFTAGNMVLGQPFPAPMIYVSIVGLLLVLLFMTTPARFKQDFINYPMLPLDVISCFVDVVSYIRLFAVGIATLAVAESFNDMAASVGFDNPLTSLVAALILLLGHGLNILLGGLAILVHGVRLNTLEFSMHKDLQWSGFSYSPFARNKPE